MKNVRIIIGTIVIGIVFIILSLESLPFMSISMLLGLVIVVLVGEPMVEGLQEFSIYTGLSTHVTGILSSIASNLPEAVMTILMVLSPPLREVAILTVLLASAFNGVLLGILVVMLTYKGGAIEIPRKALVHDVEIMRLAIAFCAIIFGTGLILTQFSETGVATLPWEIPPFLLLAYISYLYFVSREEKREQHTLVKHEKSTSWVTPIVLGLVGIVISARLISGSSEYFVHVLDLNLAIAATLIGFAGSVPEHGMALIGARGGHVELGVSNLLSGIVQSIMLIFPILALIVPVQLDGYVLYQFLAIAVTLWIVKKSIIDDGRLTIDEGVSILIIHILGILLFDELSLLI